MAAAGGREFSDCSAAAASPVAFDPVSIDKPATDYRDYQAARLTNGMRVLVVSDSKCDRAAAALSVGVGSIHDPREIQGLAHFCEHMLFLGTERFPKETEYNEYLAKSGGSSNAYTAETVTNYFFSVKPEALDGALDRFSQFFISPLFTESATDRELNAVDSEHSKNLQQDGWRMSQLMRNAVEPSHPLHHFITGNSKTLRDLPAERGIDVRGALLEFQSRYYSANLMRLVIVGREPPEELLALASSRFSPILNRESVVARDADIGGGAEIAFPPERRQRLVHVVPVNDVRTAAFQFVLPGQRERWRCKPTHYFAHLIGHEGKGSLLAVLKKRGLATELSAGDALEEAGVCVVSVTVVLTEKGEADIGTVGDLVFAYIGLLRNHGPDERLWRELQTLSQLGFRYRSVTDAVSTASGVAHALQEHEPERVLSGGALLWDYEPEWIAELLEAMRCENLRLVLSGKAFKERCTDEEPWYGTSFSDEPLGDEYRSRWEKAAATAAKGESLAADLVLPEPNPFVPDDLELRPPSVSPHPDVPHCLDLDFSLSSGVAASRVATAFFRKDEEFGLPKGACVFQLYCPFADESTENRELAELWCAAVREELNEFAYEAQMAGLAYSLQATAWGLVLSVGGYSDKLPGLLTAVTERMAGLTEVPESTYSIVRQVLERDLANAAVRSPPYQQAFSFESGVYRMSSDSFQERLDALRSAGSRENLVGVSQKLLGNCHAECLLQGNFTEAEAKGLVRSFLEPLGITEPLQELPRKGTAYLPSGTTALEREGTNAEERNGAVVATIQIAEDSLANIVLTALTAQVVSQRFFDELRTKQQLGYIVSASPFVERNGFVALRFIVQSEKPMPEVASSVQQWLETEWSFLENDLTEAAFAEYHAALAGRLRERPKSLNEEFGRNWAEIASRGFRFKHHEEELAQLEQIGLAELQRFASERLRPAPRTFVLVSAAAQADEKADTKDAEGSEFVADRWWQPEDVAAFRRNATWRLRNLDISCTV